MAYAPIPMVPGPVSVPRSVLDAMSRDYGSGQIEPDFLALYHATGRLLARLMNTRNDVVIMTGEGMLALWSGLKSCLAPGDRVLSLVTGVFGDGIGDMAASLGCEVRKVTFAFNETIHEMDRVEAAVREFRPHMITAVHCETPSGTLNPIEGLGDLKRQYGVPLLYVDAVASLGGAAVDMDAWGVDLLLGGSQKCLSAPPSMSFLGVSEAAWERAAQVGYQGYDALSPWRTVRTDGRCPYTPYWHGVAALHEAAQSLLYEGPDAVFARHESVGAACRHGLEQLGVELWVAPGSRPSPTVTAALVPHNVDWPVWQAALRRRGLIVAGSFGPMQGQVFRLGHMGSQARLPLVEQALEAIASALA
ncbi:MAG: aminotransferase class V-fold PLP-dependent enzyme [Desulfovibrionaceae bacterium]|nr:aminotransferase class V-fold PLP-dependent enzyme [Desulfovibrionaceae bacterium]